MGRPMVLADAKEVQWTNVYLDALVQPFFNEHNRNCMNVLCLTAFCVLFMASGVGPRRHWHPTCVQQDQIQGGRISKTGQVIVYLDLKSLETLTNSLFVQYYLSEFCMKEIIKAVEWESCND